MKIGRWGLHGDLIRAFRDLGLAPQQAFDASAIAERAMRARRDHYIRAARSGGASVRSIAKVWGLDHSMVLRICKVVVTDAEASHHPPGRAFPQRPAGGVGQHRQGGAGAPASRVADSEP